MMNETEEPCHANGFEYHSADAEIKSGSALSEQHLSKNEGIADRIGDDKQTDTGNLEDSERHCMGNHRKTHDTPDEGERNYEQRNGTDSTNLFGLAKVSIRSHHHHESNTSAEEEQKEENMYYPDNAAHLDGDGYQINNHHPVNREEFASTIGGGGGGDVGVATIDLNLYTIDAIQSVNEEAQMIKSLLEQRIQSSEIDTFVQQSIDANGHYNELNHHDHHHIHDENDDGEVDLEVDFEEQEENHAQGQQHEDIQNEFMHLDGGEDDGEDDEEVEEEEEEVDEEEEEGDEEEEEEDNQNGDSAAGQMSQPIEINNPSMMLESPNKSGEAVDQQSQQQQQQQEQILQQQDEDDDDNDDDEDGKTKKKSKKSKKGDASRLLVGKDFRFSKLANCHMCKRKNKYVYGCYKNWVPTSCNKFFCLDCLLNGLKENILLVVQKNETWKCPYKQGTCQCRHCLNRKEDFVIPPIAGEDVQKLFGEVPSKKFKANSNNGSGGSSTVEDPAVVRAQLKVKFKRLIDFNGQLLQKMHKLIAQMTKQEVHFYNDLIHENLTVLDSLATTLALAGSLKEESDEKGKFNYHH